MTLNFVVPEVLGGGGDSPFQFFRKGFNIGGMESSPSWRDVIISGNTALTLVNAKANGLNYLKLFGGCEQNGTPTPTQPQPIVCNNGTLKVRHQSGLPIGYQPYEYITASGNQWLDTGIKLASTDIVETEFQNSSSSGYGALYGVFSMGSSSAFYANGTYYGYDVANGKVNTGISVDTEWHTLRQDFGNGVITLDGNDTTYTPFEFDNAKNNYLFARYYNNSYGYGFKGSCKRYKVIRNGVLICDLIPVVQLSDNKIGMYDLVNDVFYGNVGSGDFTATNPINDLEIYYDGTVETVGIGDLFDSADGQGTFVSPGSTSTTRIYKAFGQLPDGKYKVAVTGNFEFIFQYKDSMDTFTDSGNIGTWTTGGVYDLDKTGYYYGIAIRYPNNARISPSDFNGTITLIPFSNSATAQPLLSVGDYKDTQEVLSGAVTRNVVVNVLDGTESWTQATTSLGVYRYRFEPTNAPKIDGGRGHCISTHFSDIGDVTTQDIDGVFASTTYLYFIPNQDVNTVEKWIAFLKNQYNAGTPVIVVYPISSPTTESVIGQPLTIQAGTNVVSITQASIDNLELEVSYKAGVEVTVEEIEAVNNDESVEVTING